LTKDTNVQSLREYKLSKTLSDDDKQTRVEIMENLGVDIFKNDREKSYLENLESEDPNLATDYNLTDALDHIFSKYSIKENSIELSFVDLSERITLEIVCDKDGKLQVKKHLVE
jgi:hypothetical protein